MHRTGTSDLRKHLSIHFGNLDILNCPFLTPGGRGECAFLELWIGVFKEAFVQNLEIWKLIPQTSLTHIVLRKPQVLPQLEDH